MAPRVPFIGRLYLTEYLALTFSFVLISLENIVRTVTLLLPGPIIRFCYRVSRSAFNSLSSPYARRARNRKKSVSSPIAQAQDFVELCELYGYYAEEHIVQTKDGYLLGLHRLGWRKGEEEQRVNAGPGSVEKKVVYLHHGLLMNSEVWVCITEKERCLPFTLVDQGYDVWLGNNRGNKYSKKCLHYAPTEIPFWNFSMDQFAFHDIPDSINYILSTTHQPSLSYIGFSQGSAQAFATLSINPTLNSKVSVFVALAPAMAPPGLASGIVASLCKSNPEILFLAFGRRAILGSTTMWQALLYPAIFGWFIDKSLSFLFGWKTRNIAPHQKLAAYPHLYSFTSTKSVVHWFQIIRNGTFQMYDDEVTTPLAVGNGSKYYKVAKFPTRNIKTPIVLIYGGSDSLVDIKLMLKELPKHTVARGIQKYEHLDLLWAHDVDKLVHPHVLEALERYGAQPAAAERSDAPRRLLGRTGMQTRLLERATMSSPNGSLPPGYESSERGLPAGYGDDDAPLDERPSTAGEQLDETDEEDEDSTPERFALTPAPASGNRSHATGVGAPALPARSEQRRSIDLGLWPSTPVSEGGKTVTSPKRRMLSPRLRGQQQQSSQRPASQVLSEGALSSPLASGFTDSSHRTRPEGWWSSASSTAESSPKASMSRLRDLVDENGNGEAGEDNGEVGPLATTSRQVEADTRTLAQAIASRGQPNGDGSGGRTVPQPVPAPSMPVSPPSLTSKRDGGAEDASPVSVVRRQLQLDGQLGGDGASAKGRRRRGSDASSISERGIGLVKPKAEAVMGRATPATGGGGGITPGLGAGVGGVGGSSGGGGKKRARRD
ncbi:hypothetical protein LTR85_011778 [Meristemomyces frigidus]|nr:hypothetical protein LTR85_011778 [Meristemomyces frigidus]